MKTYGMDDAKAIIRNYGDGWIEFKADGVHLTSELLQYDTSQVLHWKYACELDDADSPNPLTAPCLPFPFTANELTAFMLDGIGADIASNYGNWEDGPDQGVLDSMGVLARDPRRAIIDAYAAHRTAHDAVGSYHVELQTRADRLCKIYNYRNLKANAREGVVADGITRHEANARRERAIASNAELEKRYEVTKREYLAASVAWRKAMVRELLQPAPEQSPETPAPVEAASDGPAKRSNRKPSWATVAMPYMKSLFTAGNYKSAAMFYKALMSRAGESDSPFKLVNRELYCTEAGTTVSNGALGNVWPEIRAH